MESTINQSDEARIIVEAIWDYNQLFSTRFGNHQVVHLNNQNETMACPFHIFSNWTWPGPSVWNSKAIGDEVTKCFFFAYSHRCENYLELIEGGEESLSILFDSFKSPHDFINRAHVQVEGIDSIEDDETVSLQPFIGKVAGANIVCMFLPNFNNCNSVIVDRLMKMYPTIHHSKEMGMICYLNQENSLHSNQLEIMKMSYDWTLNTSGVIHAKLSDRIVLKSANTCFEDFLKFYEITCEYASMEPIDEIVTNHLQSIYNEQIIKELENSNRKLSDYIVMLDDGKIVSAGMIIYGKTVDAVAGIYCIATDQEYRGKGYATMIVISLMELAKHYGYSRAILHASEQGKSIYEKLGFQDRIEIAVCSLATFLD